MLLEIVCSFAAGVVFDYLPTKNQVSVVERQRTQAAASSFGSAIQESVVIMTVTAITNGCDKFTTAACVGFYALGKAVTTFVMVRPAAQGSQTEESLK